MHCVRFKPFEHDNRDGKNVVDISAKDIYSIHPNMPIQLLVDIRNIFCSKNLYSAVLPGMMRLNQAALLTGFESLSLFPGLEIQ